MQKNIPGFSLLLITFLSVSAVKAQKNTAAYPGVMGVGKMTLNMGAGLGVAAYGATLDYSNGLGLKAALERGMWQLGPGVLSLGLDAGGSFTSTKYNGHGYHADLIIVAARAAYHIGGKSGRFDTYGGISAGPDFRSIGYVDNKAKSVVFAPGFFAGITCLFSTHIGVNIEGGNDITEIQGGIIFKIK